MQARWWGPTIWGRTISQSTFLSVWKKGMVTFPLGLHIPQPSFSKCRCLSSSLELLAEYWIVCKRWTLAQVAQVLIIAMLNFCVVVSMDPSLLHNAIHFKWSEVWWSCREISTTTIIGNTTMSAVITSWESHKVHKVQSITFITYGNDKLPWLPTEFISSQQWV